MNPDPMNGSSVQQQLHELDESIALTRVGGDADLLREVAELFLLDYPQALDSLRRAVSDQNASAVEQHAHRLKGSISTFGANQAFEAALALERKGRSGDLAGADDNLHVLEDRLETLRPELEALQSR